MSGKNHGDRGTQLGSAGIPRPVSTPADVGIQVARKYGGHDDGGYAIAREKEISSDIISVSVVHSCGGALLQLRIFLIKSLVLKHRLKIRIGPTAVLKTRT